MSQKPKILIATGIFPPDIGGPATMLGQLASDLEKENYEIKILTYTEKKSEFNKNIYRINKHLPFKLGPLKYWLKFKKLSKWADLNYVTDTYSVGYFAYQLKKKYGQPYILRFTGDSAWETARAKNWTNDYILDFQNKKYNPKIEQLKKRRAQILKNADKIIVDCKFNKQVAQKIGASADKIKIIYNSIDFMDLKPNLEKVEKIKQKYPGKILVTACRLTRWKGIDQILKILPELNKRVNPLNFLILGDGPEKQNLQKIAPTNTYFLGRLSRDDMINYIAAADALILNSDYEGLSHILLETLEMNIPIIATHSGGNPEIIQNNKNGLLINYGHSQELYNALFKILTNFSPDFSTHNFRWQNVITQTQEVISEIL